jgi:hypothetical protein
MSQKHKGPKDEPSQDEEAAEPEAPEAEQAPADEGAGSGQPTVGRRPDFVEESGQD